MPQHKLALFVRHGRTDMNSDKVSEDRIRGWRDVPLNDAGREEAQKAAAELESHISGKAVIMSSDLKRALDTALIIGRTLHVPVYKTAHLRPWNLGRLTGMSTEKALPVIERYAWSSDTPVEGGGESFNQFRRRSFAGLREAVDAAGNDELIVVAHYRNYNLFKGWVDCGAPPDLKVRISDFVKKGEQTGGIWPFEINVTALEAGVTGRSTTDA